MFLSVSSVFLIFSFVSSGFSGLDDVSVSVCEVIVFFNVLFLYFSSGFPSNKDEGMYKYLSGSLNVLTRCGGFPPSPRCCQLFLGKRVAL